MAAKTYRESAQATTRYLLTRANGVIHTDKQFPYSSVWSNSVTYGTNVPNWRQRLKDGLPATTTLVGTRSTVRVEPGLFRYRINSATGTALKDGVATGNMELSIDPAGNPSNVDTTKADSEALGKFAKRILKAHTTFQGGVFIGELGQTLRMIKNPALGLRRLVTDFHELAKRIRATRRIGNLASHIRQVEKNLGDAYLEWQFGVKPLASDLESLCKALARQSVHRQVGVQRISAKGSTRSNVTEQIGYDIAVNSGFKFRTRVVTVGTAEVVYRGGVRLEAIDPKTLDPALFGFTPEQFLPTAWELLPWSFLIDYFVNIDDIIAGWSTLTSRLAWSVKTTRQSYERTGYAETDNSIAPGTFLSCAPAKVIANTTSVDRQPYSGTYVPGLTFSIPSFGDRKWLNIAALIASRGNDRKWYFN